MPEKQEKGKHGSVFMEAKKLEILMTAVDLGSFSKASEVVGYTQSGLTHLVNSLEREIGFPLIIRSHNGISLTEQGKELCQLSDSSFRQMPIWKIRSRLLPGNRRKLSGLPPMPVWPCSGCRKYCTVFAGSAQKWM